MSQLELIFVHGTWSDGEDFSAPTSPFVDTIVRSLGPDVVVSRFCWSGRNRVAAREQAAREFAEFARARAQLPPERLRIAICHSHGGSVVLQSFVQALEDTNPREAPPPIHGIVCIGTPFIHVARLTEAEPDADEPLSPGWYAIGGLIVWQWQRIYDVMCSIGQSMAMHPVLWAFGLVLTAVLAYAPMVLVFMFWAAKNRAFSLSDPSKEEDEFVYGPDDVVERLRNSCRLPLSEPVPTLIVKVP